MNQAVILAAGRGERLKPVTNSRSKAMLPILGKPMVARVLENLIDNGVNDSIIVMSPKDQEIIEYFKGGDYMGAGVRLVQQSFPFGTADALHQAAPFIKGDFILTACDSLFTQKDTCRLITYWSEHQGLDGLLSLRNVEPRAVVNFGIVELNGESIVRIIEKPALEDAPSETASLPIYCFSQRIIDYLPQVNPSPRGEYELQDAIQMLIDDGGKVRGINVEDRLNLTSAADLLEINLHYFRRNQNPFVVDTGAVGSRTQFAPPVKIENGTTIGTDCSIGPNVYIERDCFINDQVTLRETVVLRGTTLAKGFTASNQLLS